MFAFTRLVRSHSDLVVQQGQFTADFCTMYTSFSFNDMVSRTMSAVQEAWDFQKQRSSQSDSMLRVHCDLHLTISGWAWGDEGLTVPE